MYLIETSFTSQSVMSDTHPYKPISGSNRTEGTSEEALAIRVFTIPIGLPFTQVPCRDNRQVILSLSQIPGLHHRSSNAIHNVESHIRNGLYDTKVLSRLNRIVSENIFKTYGYGISIKSQLNNSNFLSNGLTNYHFQSLNKKIHFHNL